MPIHDWSRVSDGMFHWFHQRWVGFISDWLNAGRLPKGVYAIGEIYADRFYPDVLAVENNPAQNGKHSHSSTDGAGIAVAESPPRTRFILQAEERGYLGKKNSIAIRDVEGTLIAVIEIVSAGNKSSQKRLDKFISKTVEFLDQGVHVLVIDLFPPTPRDPLGIHHAIWRAYDGEFEFHPEKPWTLASYMAPSADTIASAYVEPIALGDALPAMPLFLSPDRYINVELEATYQSTWAVFPAPLKPKLA